MHVVGRHHRQQVLMVLSLILGVVTMHSTVVCHADTGHTQDVAAHVGDSTPTAHTIASPFAAPATTVPVGAAMAGRPGTAPAVGVADEHAGFSVGHLMAASEIALGAVAPVMRAAGPADASQPAGRHSALHDLLHLCLVVLTALLVLAAAALRALAAGRAARRGSPPAGGRPVAGPRAPPPTSVRLAQLCVLRN